MDNRGAGRIGGIGGTALRNTTSVRAGARCASHADWETQICPYRLGLSHLERGRYKEKTVIDARVEKVLTKRYFWHMFCEGRVGEDNRSGIA